MTQLSDYEQPSVAIDIAILRVSDGQAQVALVERDGGKWALPGGFVHADKSFDQTIDRVLVEKVGVSQATVEQLATYGAIDRDPRGRVISIVYLALVPADHFPDLNWANVQVDWSGEVGGIAQAVMVDQPVSLAFDHAEILGDVIKRLRGKVEYSDVCFGLLDPEFTLLSAQKVYEAILGRPLTKPAFRRKFLDRGRVMATGKLSKGAANRPAELYVVKSEKES